jgi:hypothetical protein
MVGGGCFLGGNCHRKDETWRIWRIGEFGPGECGERPDRAKNAGSSRVSGKESSAVREIGLKRVYTADQVSRAGEILPNPVRS